MRANDAIRSDRRFLWVVIVAGVAMRIAWLVAVHGSVDAFVGGGEAARAALSIARDGALTDLYFDGSGPSAHLMPIPPIVAGTILRIFGTAVEDGTASVVLLGWALAQTVAAWLLLYRLFGVLGAARRARIWGVAFLGLVPVFVPQETIDFRFWDAGLATCLALGCLTVIADIRGGAPPTSTRFAGAALLTALTAFVSPAAGLGVLAAWGWLAATRLEWRQTARFAAIGIAAFALLFAPWAWRNDHVLGQPVLTRSNFGLEFAIGNHDAAVAPRDPARTYADRVLAIHPYVGTAARADFVAAGGEVAYARRVGSAAWRWAAAHPAAFALISVRHLSQMVLPRPWQMHFTGWEGLMGLRARVMAATMLIGLAGLATGVRRGWRGHAMLGAYVVTFVLPYAFVQPVPRYAYPIYGVLAFVAIDLLYRSVVALRQRRPGQGA